MNDIVIKVDSVSKNFKLPHEKTSSIKSVFTGLVSKRRKGYEIQRALKDISFEIKRGEFFGIVGRNGSGKSTLLKILAGIYQPNKGSVFVRGKVVPFIELGVGFNPELTGRDNVFLNGALLGFSREEVVAMYDDIVEFAELERFMDQKLKNYSSGMQVRLAFSLAIRANADVLLVDEVLAVGDAAFQRKCYEYFKDLKRDKKTVVFVSHDMGAIRQFCDRALLIDNSKIKNIGDSSVISKEYSQLFIDNAANNHDTIRQRKTKRWGNGDIKFTDVKISLENDEINVVAEAEAKKEMDGVLYGLHIVGQDGSEITAMNNRMIQEPDLVTKKTDSKVVFEWKMLNVFNDGKYYVTLTLVDESGLAFDWFTDVASFVVKRAERSTTSVLPPVAVKYKVVDK